MEKLLLSDDTKDGENIKLEFKDAGNQQNTLNSILSTFAGNNSDVIVAIATPTAVTAANYSEDIPVVFSAVSDPIGAGLITDLNRIKISQEQVMKFKLIRF